MRKQLYRITALIAAVLFCLPLIVASASAAAFSMNVSSQHTIDGVVEYKSYNVTSKVKENEGSTYTLTFNPENGYIAMPFAGFAGTSANPKKQYEMATGASGSRYDYTVAGVINGAFFSMGNPYGLLTGINISNGKIESAHMPFSGSVVTFGSDGSMKIVDTSLSSSVTIGGRSYTDLIWYYNKRRSTSDSGDWFDYLYYYDKSCGTKCDSVFPGTEILCRKLDNTDIAIGRTLVGEVISVSKNTSGGAVEDDEFVLYYPDNRTTYTSLVQGLQPGEKIEISVTEKNSSARAATESAVVIISNVGRLVMNGMDLTLSQSTIGTHSVTLARAWTAFGTKPDGSYVFLVSEENKLTMRDVAQQMIKMGCNNVVRMDGGGSSAMYLSDTGSGSAGYAYSAGGANYARPVGDCILVLKASSARSDSLKTALAEKISAAEAVIGNKDRTVLDAARAIYASETAIDGDYKHAIMDLTENYINGKAILRTAVNELTSAALASGNDRALDIAQMLSQEANRLIEAGSENACLEFEQTVSDIDVTGYTGKKLSLGAQYATAEVNTGFPDTGRLELTDGALFGLSASAPQWTGFKQGDKTGTDETGDYVDIFVDLGTEADVSAASLSALNMTSWGVRAPKRVVVLSSANGTEFTELASLESAYTAAEGACQPVYYDNAVSAVRARYFKFRAYFAATHMFVGEVTLYGGTGVNAVKLTGINKKIAADDAVVFTPSFGTVTAGNANLNWTRNYICVYDSTLGAYVVESITANNGKTDYSYELGDNKIIVALHGSSVGAVSGKVGNIVSINGIDISESRIYSGARINFFPNTERNLEMPVDGRVFTEESGITVDENGMFRLPEGITHEKLGTMMATGDYTLNASGKLVGSGSTVAVGGKVYTAYVLGDADGSGRIDAVDYLYAKRAYLGTYTLSGACRRAVCINNGETIELTDLIRMKRHTLGTEYIK